MKILHTSDWHIGKKLMGRDRSDEFAAVLSEIAELCESQKIDICLVAGDVFDTYTPSAEAEEIFYAAVKNIAKYCAVLIISGNHDDYVRLTAASALAQELNIFIIGNNLQKIKCNKRGNCYPVESDSGYAIFENLKGERLYINTLPYPNEARFKQGKSDLSFDEKMSEWIAYGERGNNGEYPSVLLAHIFVQGGLAGDTEREIDLGGARLVKKAMLPNCAYAALGHLHKRQNISDTVCYSGAPMYFSFDESGDKKSVNVLDITPEGVKDFKQVELKSIKKLVRLQALSPESGIEVLNANADSYAELTLKLSAPLTRTQNLALHKCENLVSLKAEVAAAQIISNKPSVKGKKASELFDDYYKSKYDCLPPADLKELFLSLTEEE